jgi:hypothetical protein
MDLVGMGYSDGENYFGLGKRVFKNMGMLYRLFSSCYFVIGLRS